MLNFSANLILKNPILSKLNIPPRFSEWLGYETPSEKLHQGKNICLNITFPQPVWKFNRWKNKFPKELIFMVS